GADVIWAERSDTRFLWFGQWYFDISVNPRQRLIAFYGVYPGAFFSRQLHALYYRLAINHRGATANRPEPTAVSIRLLAITLLLIQKLIENHGR
ncbi:hypothetical protein AS299_14920, partial [Citrobacter freundii]